MKVYDRARRVGRAAILLAVVLRLWSAGLPELLIQSLLTKRETGQDARFSDSFGNFFPDFSESFSAMVTEPALPVFSGSEHVPITNFSRKEPEVSSALQRELRWSLYGQEPAVLILHTHSTESYTKQEENYDETSAWRTLDERYNMLSIGAHVAQRLKAAGIPTVQDRTIHDHPSYNGSYVDARKSIKAFLEQFPTIRLILDLHRDASGGASQMRTSAQVEGKTAAQLMVVLGTNYDTYEDNLSLGLKLHAQLEQTHPGLMRPLQLRTQRFNQDLSPGALLIEVGAAGNTHSEALAAAEALADAVIALASGTEAAALPAYG